MLDAGYWMLDAGYWMLDDGYWIPDVGKNTDLNCTCNTAHHLLHIVAMLLLYSYAGLSP